MVTPDLGVIICTCNPDLRVLDWVLEGLALQTLPADRYEVVVVDNGSTTPVAIENTRGLCLRIAREPRNGLSFARSCGIEETHAALLVFVDDDNRLAPDYLETALDIARREPRIGAFGGVIAGAFEESPQRWQRKMLLAVGIRDCGPEPITAASEEWGDWIPIGPGMVCRRSAAERYRDQVTQDRWARGLGRSTSSWISGDDTLLARSAVQCGYACSYQPALRLEHRIRSSRLRIPALTRTMFGHGRAYAILEHLRGSPNPGTGLFRQGPKLFVQLARRIWAGGLISGVLHWIWDCGAALQFYRLRGVARSNH